MTDAKKMKIRFFSFFGKNLQKENCPEHIFKRLEITQSKKRAKAIFLNNYYQNKLKAAFFFVFSCPA